MGDDRVHDLEIDQDLAFMRRSWIAQRAGWLGMGIILVLAVAGVFGSGPFSRSEGGVPGLLHVGYQRFARCQAPHTLTVRLEPAATRTGEVRLWVDRRYLADSRVDAVTPPPTRVEAAGDRLVYVFSTSQPGRPLTVVFALQAERFGRGTGRVGVDGAEAFAEFWQLVYP